MTDPLIARQLEWERPITVFKGTQQQYGDCQIDGCSYGRKVIVIRLPGRNLISEFRLCIQHARALKRRLTYL